MSSEVLWGVFYAFVWLSTVFPLLWISAGCFTKVAQGLSELYIGFHMASKVL